MNANEPRRRLARFTVAVIVLAGSGAAWAQTETAPSPGWPDADIVDEMLRRETRAALAAQGRRRAAIEPRSATPSTGSTEPGSERIDLAAIYGVGKRLHVELLLNGQRLRYRHGRKWPDEAPDGAGVYALRAIEGSCVKLDGAAGDRRLCLARGH